MTKHILSDVEDRFWKKVTMDLSDYHSCWEWTGAIGNHGYGVLGLGRRKDGTITAPRLSYLIHHGPITPGYDICHKCNNRKCVHPNHIYEGTRAENVADAMKAGTLKRPYKPWSDLRRAKYNAKTGYRPPATKE